MADRGISVVRIDPHFSGQNAARDSAATPKPSSLFCLFVLGGDGTFLSAVRWIGNTPLPVLGVKFGQVGFLAETTAEDLFSAAEAVIQRDFAIQQRMRLAVTVIKDGRERSREVVLNDVVVTKSTLARLAHVEVYIDNHYLTTFSGRRAYRFHPDRFDGLFPGGRRPGHPPRSSGHHHDAHLPFHPDQPPLWSFRTRPASRCRSKSIHPI